MKKYLIVVNVIVIMTLIIWQEIRIVRLNDKAQLQAVELAALKDSVSVYRGKNGELTYKLISVEIDKGNLKESLEIAGFEIEKLKAENIKLRNVVQAMKIEMESSGSGEVVLKDTVLIEKTDTVRYSAFNWSNDYLKLSGKVFQDRMNFEYSYRTDIDFITEKRKKETIVTVCLSDPNATIVSGRSISIKRKKNLFDRWWLWAAAGVGTGIIISK